MKLNKKIFLLFIVMLPFFLGSKLSAAPPTSSEELNWFIKSSNIMTNWFNQLSSTYDEIVKKEKRKQLIMRMTMLSRGLYELEISRDNLIRSIVSLDSSRDDREKIIWYSEKMSDFSIDLEGVESQLQKVGSLIRQEGRKGHEIEQIIRYGFNYKSPIPINSIKTTSGVYGGITVDYFDKSDILDESKRCREALRDAQVAASEFLELLKEK